MVGQQFGRLIVLSQAPKRLDLKNKGKRWNCLCVCGQHTEVNGGGLKTGHVKSCRCSRKEQARGNFGRYAFGQLFSRYKSQARERGFSFHLTREQFKLLTQGSCFYCGTPPIVVYTKRNSSYTYNGIDRRDNSKGYTLENCVSCCAVHNHMKSDMSYDEFVAACRSVVKHFEE